MKAYDKALCRVPKSNIPNACFRAYIVTYVGSSRVCTWAHVYVDMCVHVLVLVSVYMDGQSGRGPCGRAWDTGKGPCGCGWVWVILYVYGWTRQRRAWREAQASNPASLCMCWHGTSADSLSCAAAIDIHSVYRHGLCIPAPPPYCKL